MRPVLVWGLAAACALLAGPVDTESHAGAPTVQIETVPLRRQSLSETVEGYGTVATSEDAIINISFPRAGQVAELQVRLAESVRAGQALVRIDADPATLSSYERALAGLEFAKREFERSKALFAQHLATNAQVAAAQKVVEDATVSVDIERKLGHDQTSELLHAPFDGYVVQVTAGAGDRIQPNTVVLKLARTDRGTRVTVGLRSDEARRVAAGMKAEVTAVLTTDPRPITGTIRGLGGTVNPATKLIDAWVDLENSGTLLVPGTAVTVKIVLSEHTGWVVPRSAVLHDSNGDYIFQVQNTTARRIAVRTGIVMEEGTEISGDFDAGLKVVAVGNYELDDGMAVREAGPAPSAEK